MTIQIERPTETQTKTVRDVLLHAALLIEERGWCQGWYESPEGQLCMTGAVNVAAGDPPDQWPDSGLAFAAMRRTYHPGPGGEAWNDEPGRTAADVIAALRSAAEETL